MISLRNSEIVLAKLDLYSIKMFSLMTNELVLSENFYALKWIVSRDFLVMKSILMDRK